MLIPDLIDQALPGLLKALKGDGNVQSFGKLKRITDDWIVIIEGELGPVSVGEYLDGHVE